MKAAIALDEALGLGLMANAAACIASGLFASEEFLGRQIEGKECLFEPITKIPILILKQNGKLWPELVKRAKKGKLKYVIFTKEAQSTTSYEEYEINVAGKNLDDLHIIGIGVVGEDKLVGSFCGDLPLMR